MAKCPKCGMQVASPRKTWKMAGRPDRSGKRTELNIGLFDCPKDGAFRVVLGKRKIQTQTQLVDLPAKADETKNPPLLRRIGEVAL